ncbi:adenosylcobyric acid synthase (glutamine-hydrolysing) [Halogranum gelatinilyticum]|uniref:Probable cobyric acid synthase n=1 Tax=Halogranum gelatinilyticum TaxID=660521 RepID=A0A1G9Q7U4_9EURY|nr:cobyric acid synthase [Halogranum gelatinilyticum]SDM07013.1 adenosylcobyric acid synthase (glutamine-hydrolysing) [Halogranum gelatinilyticum]
MPRTLLVAGTASHVGKSTVAAGLCRYLADRGVSVAPFKAQNMSNNARAVPRPAALHEADGDDAPAFGEVGVSQYTQARAARVRPTTDHNPVLLKPRGDGESQLVVDGVAVGHFAAGNYYDDHWHDARDAAVAAHGRLARDHDVVVAEGAGSIAEINLHDRDLANVETARFAGQGSADRDGAAEPRSGADILLVADIERGGVFASLVGTLELLPDDLRGQVVGVVITKFRGDVSLLQSGLDAFEERTGVPILGVIPYDDPGLPAEDSVSLPPVGERSVVGDDDGVSDDESVTVAVPRLPRISNFTDLDPLAAEPGVRVAYVPLDDDLTNADAVVLPGTKNTVDDLLACREAGLHEAVRDFDGPVVGLCGGYQLLGERITNAAVESVGSDGAVAGFGLLPVETAFSPDKRVSEATWRLDGTGPLAGAAGDVSGYEIHAGETRPTGAVETPFARGEGEDGSAALGAAAGDVLGTYLHGLFENRVARDAFVDATFAAAGRARPTVDGDRAASPYDRAAGLVADNVDLRPLGLDVESGHTGAVETD